MNNLIWFYKGKLDIYVQIFGTPIMDLQEDANNIE